VMVLSSLVAGILTQIISSEWRDFRGGGQDHCLNPWRGDEQGQWNGID